MDSPADRPTSDPNDEVEAERLARLAEFEDLGAPESRDRFVPGSFGCHELLDRTALLANSVEEWLLGHPACLSHPDWYRLAQGAFATLDELYRRIADAHIVEGPDPASTGPVEPASDDRRSENRSRNHSHREVL
ncbi:MAG: hypothetical protein U0790_27140 [Isosphaeraceae bacterium]